jgi:hypothetical protein
MHVRPSIVAAKGTRHPHLLPISKNTKLQVLSNTQPIAQTVHAAPDIQSRDVRSIQAVMQDRSAFNVKLAALRRTTGQPRRCGTCGG